MMDLILRFDWSVFQFVEQYLWADWLTPVMVGITKLGEHGILWIAIAVLLLFFRKYRKAGISMLAALLIMQVCNNVILKEWIARPRPFDLAQWKDIFIYPDIIAKPASSSFPSGHTASAFCAVTAFAFASRNRLLSALGYIMAVLVALSRIYLHVHYCTDILGGMGFGILYGIAAYLMVNGIIRAAAKKRADRITS